MPLQPITGQSRYPDGPRGASPGDRRFLAILVGILLAAHIAVDYFGFRLPSQPVVEFVADVALVWGGIHWARTRQP